MMNSQKTCQLLVASWLMCLLLATGCATSPQQDSMTAQADDETQVANEAESTDAETMATEEKNPDPWEKMNRKLFKMNDNLDRVLLKPIAKAYNKVMPNFLLRAVDNVFGNLGDIGDAVNNLLQGKVKESASDVGRVLVNSTIGLGGLFDPASRMNLVDHDEDFSQTLAKWGVPSGPYLVLPLLGPTTLRGLASSPVDTQLDLLRYLKPVKHRNALYGVDTIHGRSGLLAAESVIFGDKYIFIRDAYLQRENYQSSDGQLEDYFDDEFEDDFGDEFEDDWGDEAEPELDEASDGDR